MLLGMLDEFSYVKEKTTLISQMATYYISRYEKMQCLRKTPSGLLNHLSHFQVHISLCAHGSQDRRCSVCGSVLIKRSKEEISSRGIQGEVFGSPCSHIGCRKCAGNVIIFSQTVSEEILGQSQG